jgi:lipoprotein-releasing system ATP-binding protein
VTDRSAISLEVENVYKQFPSRGEPVDVLRGVTFSMSGGDSLAITGPSGSGKSTLLHLIGTLDSPSSGEIRIAGENPFALGERALALFRSSNIGFIFQDHHLLLKYSVVENVLFPTLARPGKRRQAEDRQRAEDLLQKVDLGHRLSHRPAELSGGERQRAAVARSLINRPNLLLCDEPTGSLDHANANAVAQLLYELHQQEQTILIVVTHSLELAYLFNRRFELREGVCSVA